MAVSTNKTVLRYVVEASRDTLPASPEWKEVEVNNPDQLGASLSTETRDPISSRRSGRKGTVTDLDSSVSFSADLTLDTFDDFAQGFMFSVWKQQPMFEPSGVTATGYTVTAGQTIAANSLVYARNFGTSGNNGVKPVTSALGSGDTEIVVSGLTLEAGPLPGGSRVDVCGLVGDTGDIEIDASGNIISTLLDFTTFNIEKGQAIYIGGTDTANSFDTAAYKGTARVRLVETNKITIDEYEWTVAGLDAGTGKNIHIYFGSFIRDVPTTHADFREIYHQFELEYTGFETGSATQYEYAKGNLAANATFSFPLTTKATCTMGFTGTDTPVPTDTRPAGSTTAVPYLTDAINTSSDFVRIALKNSSSADLTSYFKNLDITINNNVTPAKIIGILGAKFMNYGNFTVSISSTAVFTNTDLIAAIRNNEDVSMFWCVRNSDGGMYVDVPALSLGDGNKTFTADAEVEVGVTGMVFEEDYFGHSLGITRFPYLPQA